MLKISDQARSAMRAQSMRDQRPAILKHWHQELNTSGTIVGEPGRNAVLADVEQIGLNEPNIDPGTLTMMADLMLVDLANQRRNAH